MRPPREGDKPARLAPAGRLRTPRLLTTPVTRETGNPLFEVFRAKFRLSPAAEG